MMREFSVVVERDSEGYYVAWVPAIPGCHTQARSLDELMCRIGEAIELNLEAAGEPVEPLEFVGVQRVSDGWMTRLPSLTRPGSCRFALTRAGLRYY